jgi:hypothetical protein
MTTLIPFTLYWINLDRAAARRMQMYMQCLALGLPNQRVPAVDAQQAHGGNVPRARILSHLRAMRTVHQYRLPNSGTLGQIAMIAEDDLSFEYCPYWDWNLLQVVQRAPLDWGILQLAYACTHPKEEAFDSPHAPYIPWRPSFGSTCCYLIHPRGYTAILAAADRGAIRLDAPSEHLFQLTRTYTFARPLFTYRSDPGARADLYPQVHTDYHERCKDRLDECLIDNKVTPVKNNRR